MATTRRRMVIAQEQRGVDLAYACLKQRRSEDVAADAVYRVHNEMPRPSARGTRSAASARGDGPLVIMRVST